MYDYTGNSSTRIRIWVAQVATFKRSWFGESFLTTTRAVWDNYESIGLSSALVCAGIKLEHAFPNCTQHKPCSVSFSELTFDLGIILTPTVLHHIMHIWSIDWSWIFFLFEAHLIQVTFLFEAHLKLKSLTSRKEEPTLLLTVCVTLLELGNNAVTSWLWLMVPRRDQHRSMHPRACQLLSACVRKK
jgi:hypothetical protein